MDLYYINRILYVICLFQIGEVASTDCPKFENADKFMFSIKAMCYQYIEAIDGSQVSFDYANGDCRSRQGNLLTIKTSEIQEAITKASALGQVSDSHTIILGLKRSGSGWTWVTGETATYFNWKPNFPSTGDCVTLDLQNNATWETVSCEAGNWYYAYVCEYDTSSGNSVFVKSWLGMSVLPLLAVLLHS